MKFNFVALAITSYQIILNGRKHILPISNTPSTASDSPVPVRQQYHRDGTTRNDLQVLVQPYYCGFHNECSELSDFHSNRELPKTPAHSPT